MAGTAAFPSTDSIFLYRQADVLLPATAEPQSESYNFFQQSNMYSLGSISAPENCPRLSGLIGAAWRFPASQSPTISELDSYPANRLSVARLCWLYVMYPPAALYQQVWYGR